jgi:threonine aldolase
MELGLTVEAPDSNMVFFQPPAVSDINDFVAAMGAAGVRCAAVAGRIRLVTHLDVTSEDVEVAIGAIAGLV